MRDTVITHSRLAWRHERAQAAVASHHGLQALPIEGLAARLAGGFLQPIDPDALKAAITKALSADLGDLDRIKELPGSPRAAAATLSKAWAAGLNLADLAATAGPEAASRLAAVARLEEEVLRHLPSSMCRPADLVGAALQRTSYAGTLFGRVAVHGRTEMSPVWRPLLAALAAEIDVQWLAGPRHVPTWVHELGIPVVDAIAYQPIGLIDLVIDWKTDVSPAAQQIDLYRGQLRDYLTATGAPEGLIVFVTTGQIVRVRLNLQPSATANAA